MQGKRTDFENADCAIARSLGVVGDWWSLLIVREALFRCNRFSEFQRNLGIARNILSTRLKLLCERGILQVESTRAAASGRRYVLTPKGEQLSVVLVALWQWGEDHCFAPGELRHETVDVAAQAPLARLQLTADDGRRLGPRDFTIISKTDHRVAAVG